MAKTLTTAAVQKLKVRAGEKRREVRDGASTGLYLVIQYSGHKSWALRFRRPSTRPGKPGKPGKLTLGPVDFSGAELVGAPQIGQPLSLPAARQLAAEVHRQRAMGRDVVNDVKANKKQKLVAVDETFAVLARRYMREHAIRRTRRWQATARVLGLKYASAAAEPVVIPGGLVDMWGDRPITEIADRDVRDVVYKCQHVATPGAKKLRRREKQSDAAGRAMVRTLSALFKWLVAAGKMATSPVAGVRAPKHAEPRDRVLTDDEIRKFWLAAEQELPEFSAPLKLLLLTGCRLNEVAGMRRVELSPDLSTWTIPGSRTKNKKTHVVPLSPLARELIPATGEGDCVFSTTRGRRPIELGTKLKKRIDARATMPHWVLHDLRRTVVTGMVELGISTHVVELVVNHVSGTRGGVAGIYNRAVMMPERRVALERWAAHVAGIVADRPANVVTIRSAS